jgi:hypothetical protein
MWRAQCCSERARRVGVDHHHVVEREHVAWAMMLARARIDLARRRSQRAASSELVAAPAFSNSPCCTWIILRTLTSSAPGARGPGPSGFKKLQILRSGKLWLIMEN